MIPGFQANATGRTFVGGGTVSWEYEMIDMVDMIDMDILVVGSQSRGSWCLGDGPA